MSGNVGDTIHIWLIKSEGEWGNGDEGGGRGGFTHNLTKYAIKRDVAKYIGQSDMR